MTYEQVIKKNQELSRIISWWPKYAYHFTNISNAVSILTSGILYSREKVKKLGLMKNENASRQVIEMTNLKAKENVRFYFRPLNPTQYYNEGYKHELLRYERDGTCANIPVPVFFLFDLATLLEMEGVQFSEQSQAGHGSPLLSGINDFENLNFQKIYSYGPMTTDDEKKYRHAEILYAGDFRIDSCLKAIVCRNDIEKRTLLNLLKSWETSVYHKYKGKIYSNINDIFYKNGLFVENVTFFDDKITFRFSDTIEKRRYEKGKVVPPIDANAEFAWLGKKSKLVYSGEACFKVKYENPGRVSFVKLPRIESADTLRVKLYFEGSLMCFIEQSLKQSEVIF